MTGPIDGSPPRLLRRLLSWLLPAEAGVRDGLLGDLDELYAERVAGGRAAANIWFGRQVLTAGTRYGLRRALRSRTGVAQGFRHALRAMNRRRGFTSVIVLTLGLGIGSTTAVFSVVRSVLLRPLPFPGAERLAVVKQRAPMFNAGEVLISPPEYVAYRSDSKSWEALAAYQNSAATLRTPTRPPERISIARVTPNLFLTLGTAPLIGSASGDVSDDAAVLSYEFWSTHYARSADVLGRPLQLGGTSYTIVAVMPRGFRFPSPDVAVWLPFSFTEANMRSAGNHSYSIVGRLRHDIDLSSAEGELNRLLRFHTWHPAHVRSLGDEIVGDVRTPLWLMLSAATLVLLVACGNVMNLLVVRSEERAHEMSVRAALGARRGQLVLQLFAEAISLAALGGLAGTLAAHLGVNVLRVLAPADLPRLDEIAVDASVLGFTLAITAAAAVVCAAAPAFHSGQADLQPALRDESRSATPGRGRMRLRQGLVIAQTALAVVLLLVAGLVLRSVRNLLTVDPGYVTDQVVTAQVTSSNSAGPELVSFFGELSSRVAAIPGVIASGAALRAPLAGALDPTDIEVGGWLNLGNAPRPVADVQAVTPGYFEAMGIPLSGGRRFDRRDGLDDAPVAIVSEALANVYWPGRSPLGGRIRVDIAGRPFAEVVGVVPDVRQARLDRPAERGTLYFPYAQTPRSWGRLSSMTLTVRTSIDPTTVVSAIRREAQALDPAAPIYGVRTMRQVIGQVTATQRFSMLLQTVFSIVALLLATVGLYSVLAFTVARRASEMGIRMTLGATRADVQRMVVRQGLRLVAAGLVLGLVTAAAISGFLQSQLFAVSPLDPITYVSVVSVLLAAALTACWFPSRQASRIDPIRSLRGR
jgi:putative ABC transport system permease protein